MHVTLIKEFTHLKIFIMPQDKKKLVISTRCLGFSHVTKLKYNLVSPANNKTG